MQFLVTNNSLHRFELRDAGCLSGEIIAYTSAEILRKLSLLTFMFSGHIFLDIEAV